MSVYDLFLQYMYLITCTTKFCYLHKFNAVKNIFSKCLYLYSLFTFSKLMYYFKSANKQMRFLSLATRVAFGNMTEIWLCCESASCRQVTSYNNCVGRLLLYTLEIFAEIIDLQIFFSMELLYCIFYMNSL